MADDSDRQRTLDPSGWLIVRRDGTVVTAERRACELLGAPDTDALVGRDWASLLAGPTAAVVEQATAAVAAGAGWRGVILFRYGHAEANLATSISPVSPSAELMVVSIEPAPEAAAAPPHARTGAPPRPAGTRAAPPASPAPPTPPTTSGRRQTDPAPSLAGAEGSPPRREDDLRALISAYEALQELDEPLAAARSMLQSLQGAVPFEWAAVLRIRAGDNGTPAGVEVVATYPTPMAGVSRGAAWSPPSPAEALVAASGEPSIQGDLSGVREEGTPLARLPSYGLRSRLLIPLFAGASVAGILALFRAGPRAFVPQDGIAAERIARRLGTALQPQGDVMAAPAEAPSQPTTPPVASQAPPSRHTPPAAEDQPAASEAPSPASDTPARPDAETEAHPLTSPSTEPPPAALAGARLESLGELVAGVAHELNNPLTAILGYAQILGTLEGSEREHALRTIEDEAQRAARIVRNLLSFARQRPGQRSRVDLEEVIRRIVDLRRYALEVEEIRVVTRFGGIPPVSVDEGQFEQVILNLLNNAQQALARTGGEVTISTWQGGEHVYVSVADDGPGVPEELRTRVFEPFFTTQDVGGGQGMGLAIVYGAVTQHGGRTWVESNDRGGATFVIELPLRTPSPGMEAPSEGATETPSSAPAAAPSARPTSRRVLLVDDDLPVQAVTREILAAAGFEVETADRGDEAFDRLEHMEDVALVITDLRMPGMDGATLYEAITARWPHLARRVLFITGDIEGEPNARSLDVDRIRYLEKPFTARELLDAVEDILRSP